MALLVVMALVATMAAGCAAPNEKAQATATPTSATIPLPPMLGAYHVYTTDLLTGVVASLGAQSVQVSHSVHGIGISRDGSWLYTTDVANNRLVAFHLQQGRLTDEHTVNVGAYPAHMIETTDLRYLFVTNFSGSSVSVISTATWSVVKTITTPSTPHSIVLSPDGKLIYVACYASHELAVIGVATQALVATIPFPAQALPYGLAISPDGRYLYAGDNFGGRVYVVNTATQRLTTSISVGKSPALITRAPDGLTIYVANTGSSNVSAVDIANPAAPRVVATISVVGFPHGLSVTPDGRYVVVTGTSSGELSFISTITDTVIATVGGLRYPMDTVATAA